jgi:hypothetical protein
MIRHAGKEKRAKGKEKRAKAIIVWVSVMYHQNTV